MIRIRKSIISSLVALLTVTVSIASIGVVSAQSRPPTPTIYSGSVTAAGSPVPDGFQLTAKIRNYQTEPVAIINGKYQLLVIQPPDDSYDRGIVTFHINELKAAQIDTFVLGGLPTIKSGYNLTFQVLPAPTPTPSPVPPTPTPTPQVALPSAYAGAIIIAGGAPARNSALVARVGDYESLPAIITGGNYAGLVLDPQDFSLIGLKVEFILDGYTSSNTSIYQSGSSNRDFDLIFVGIPTPTPTDTPTPPTETPTATPTATPVPPTETATPPPPTATPIPPTTTPIPPTATPVQPTATRVPPTATAVQPTATPAVSLVVRTPLKTSSAPTPVPEGPPSAGCGASFGRTSLVGGMGNLLMLFGPLLGLVVLKARPKNRR